MNEKKEESESGLQSHEQEGWRFISVKLDMLNTKQLDQISDVLPLQRLPDILYGGNRFYMVQEARDVMYEVNPLTWLSLAHFDTRAKYLKGSGHSFGETEPRPINVIDLIPKDVEVA